MMQSYISRLVRRFAGLSLLALGAGTLGAHAQTAVANKGIQLNGTSKYGSTATAINLSGTAFTMEGWVKIAAFKTISPFITSIMGMEDVGGTALVRAGDINQPATQLQFVLQVGPNTTTNPQSKLNSNRVLSTNTWYHVAATFDGTTMKLYIDGILDGSLAVSGSAVANAVFALGRNYENARILNGALDEVRVWNRALTATEILANRCQVASTTGLMGLWRLDDGTGTTAADQSGATTLHPITLTSVVAADWITATPTLCARPAATLTGAAASGLQVVPTENPVLGTSAGAEIRGAAGQLVQLQVLNTVGQVVLSQQVKATSATERVVLALPQAAGLYVLRVSTANGIATAKLLKN